MQNNASSSGMSFPVCRIFLATTFIMLRSIALVESFTTTAVPMMMLSSSLPPSAPQMPTLLLSASSSSSDENADTGEPVEDPVEEEEDISAAAAIQSEQQGDYNEEEVEEDTNDTTAADLQEEEEEEDDDIMFIPTKIPTKESPYWELGNDFDQFLNQCTIQTFMFLLKTCRDPQTLLWVERFTQPQITADHPVGSLPTGGSGNSRLLTYHGLGAMNTTLFPSWDGYFRVLLEQPQELYTIEAWEAHQPDYEMDINPASLCTRMISVREQVARELAKDLLVVAGMGSETLLAYWKQKRGEGDQKEDPLRAAGAASMYFLDFMSDEDSALNPSPLRKGNFDLVILLATQESVHRVLNNNGGSTGETNDEPDEGTARDPMSQSNRSFLSNFYLNRLVSHFTGRQRSNQADAFIQELLSSAPTVSEDEDSLVDPTFIAEHVLAVRQEVATEWAELSQDIPNRHVEIKRLQLDLLMQSYAKEPEDGFQ